MTLAAGIDIGNSTTEIVFMQRTHGGSLFVVDSARTVTRGVKGSPESLAAAAMLVRRMLRRGGLILDVAGIAPLHPVRSDVHLLAEPPPDTGRLSIVASAARTAHGDGSVCGVLVDVEQIPPSGEPVVVFVGRGVRFDEAAQLIESAVSVGARVDAVLVERDEAVLIANRVSLAVPIVDEVPAHTLSVFVGQRRFVAVEARPAGRGLTDLTDPFWLVDQFGLDDSDRDAVQRVCAELADASHAVVALDAESVVVSSAERGLDLVSWRDCDGTHEGPLASNTDHLAALPPGAAFSIMWSDGKAEERVGDVFGARLADIARFARSRRGAVATSGVAVARLGGQQLEDVSPATVLHDLLCVEVLLVDSEAACGALGGLSTPGVPRSAVVVDLGGGTIDVMSAGTEQVVAGAGELLTSAVAAALGIPRGFADYVKRGPALMASSPQIVVDEAGHRTFTDAPLPGSSIGSLCAPGPVGLMPFSSALSSSEWRAWRRAAKSFIIGVNLRRALEATAYARSSIVLVGGAAGDDEIVSCVAEQLPEADAIGRGNVGGELGHRYAVAYGLAVTALIDR